MSEITTDSPHRRITDKRIEPAQRITRLPPYLFGKLNALKLAKRQAGVDIIDTRQTKKFLPTHLFSDFRP